MSSFRRETLLWMLQRGSAVVLAMCVLVHLATVIYAVQGGLSAAEILGRTRGNYAWAAFYSTFVLACAIHVPIGLRAVLAEWLAWRSGARDLALFAFAALIATTGMRAVIGVFA